MSRPEHLAPPELHYDAEEAQKYTERTRIVEIQRSIAERAIELLNFQAGERRLVLDIGAGSGLSGDVLSEAGHEWIGLDISEDMLQVANERGVDGDLMLNDMGQGFGFRPGMFDGAISVSAVQWLCYSNDKGEVQRKRISTFFQSLYRALHRGARAVLQIYPESPEQVEMLTTAATRCGFTGGLVVDYPHSAKARKHYLCLFAGLDAAGQSTEGKVEDSNQSQKLFDLRRSRYKKKGKGARAPVKSRDWVLQKKETQRRRGRKVRPDTKYTARKRKDKF